jgi:feruloyl-CoA synthase
MSERPNPSFWNPTVEMETRPDGTIYVWQTGKLERYPDKLNERLVHWAHAAPDRAWMAERDDTGAWRSVTYAQALQRIECVAQALLDAGLSRERPLLILSGNSTSHALMALAAQHVGIPSAAIAPAYALTSTDYGKLRDIGEQLTPGMVFADDAGTYASAIDEVFHDIPVACVEGTAPARNATRFDDLIRTRVTEEVRRAYSNVGPDTIAKFLFTSGTTGSPKAVIQTQRMLCSNQEMVADCYRFLRETPPVLVDWAPWNHTASGNKVFNIAIYHGGTYHIDKGRPTAEGIKETIRNLKEIAPTWYFNVPVGWQMLLDAMETDDDLRRTFFSRLSMMMYAGAGMSQTVWGRLTRVAEEMVPGGVLLATGIGATETGPFALMCTDRQEHAGNLGVPAREVVLKLVPQEDKLEARLKSPSVTPGYWRNEKLTKEAFDEEGFYCLGDALRFAVPCDASKGFLFDGRLAENFKLDTGTWVATGPVRAAFVNDMRGLASDAVITGEGRAELGALVLPDWNAIRALLGRDARHSDLLADRKLRQTAAASLAEHGNRATGSSNRVKRMIFLDHSLDFDRGEVTDKGSINQSAVLRHRQPLVAALYDGDPRVILPSDAEELA